MMITYNAEDNTILKHYISICRGFDTISGLSALLGFPSKEYKAIPYKGEYTKEDIWIPIYTNSSDIDYYDLSQLFTRFTITDDNLDFYTIPCYIDRANIKDMHLLLCTINYLQDHDDETSFFSGFMDSSGEFYEIL